MNLLPEGANFFPLKEAPNQKVGNYFPVTYIHSPLRNTHFFCLKKKKSTLSVSMNSQLQRQAVIKDSNFLFICFFTITYFACTHWNLYTESIPMIILNVCFHAKIKVIIITIFTLRPEPNRHEQTVHTQIRNHRI